MSVAQNLASFVAPSLADQLSVLEFRGEERLCRPFAFDVHLRVTGEKAHAVDDRAAIGSAATLRLQRGDDDRPHVFQGILSRVSLLAGVADWALYRVRLVPRLWRLGLTRHSRVFTKTTVPDAIVEVLESAGLAAGADFELRLQETYPEEELIAQYRESKLHFIQRWMERDGLYYFFEHDEDDGGLDKLVLADHPAAHSTARGEAIPYRPLAGQDASAAECFSRFTKSRDAVVGAVRLSDYDYARPALDLTAEATVSPEGFGEIVHHQGRFFEPAEAKRYAKLQAEAIAAAEVTYQGVGSCLGLSAGFQFEASEHPDDRLNATYLVTRVMHAGNQLEGDMPEPLRRLIEPRTDRLYEAQVEAIPTDRPFRAPSATRWPRVMGYETAVVDGPAESEYAQIDDQGRYLVRLRFDESRLEDGKRSTYVRMMQPHGGTTEGFHFPLRKGTEVKLGFDEGDPDRPFIAGVVPNTVTPSPVTQSNHTQNVIQSGGGNYITMEDEADKQWVDMYSPVDQSTLHLGDPRFVDADAGLSPRLQGMLPQALAGASAVLATAGTAAFWFGGNWWSNTGGFRVDIVQGDTFQFYLSNHTQDVGANQSVVVSGLRSDNVDSGVNEKYGSFHNTTVSGPRTEIAADVTETYDSQTTTVSGARTLTADGFNMVTSNAGEAHGVTGWFNVEASGGIKLDAPSVHTHASGDVLIQAPSIRLVSPDYKQVDPSAKHIFAISDWNGSKKAEFTGLVVGGTGVKIEGALLKLENQAASIKKIALTVKQAATSDEKGAVKTAARAVWSELCGIKTIV
ncbi:MAG: type VI secretion system tip protein TssI/VgrG [Myxococcota bacterium]